MANSAETAKCALNFVWAVIVPIPPPPCIRNWQIIDKFRIRTTDGSSDGSTDNRADNRTDDSTDGSTDGSTDSSTDGSTVTWPTIVSDGEVLGGFSKRVASSTGVLPTIIRVRTVPEIEGTSSPSLGYLHSFFYPVQLSGINKCEHRGCVEGQKVICRLELFGIIYRKKCSVKVTPAPYFRPLNVKKPVSNETQSSAFDRTLYLPLHSKCHQLLLSSAELTCPLWTTARSCWVWG